MLGLGASTEGVCSECGGTYYVQRRNTEKTSGLKDAGFRESLGCDWNSGIHWVGHNAGNSIRASLCDLKKDVANDASIGLVRISKS